MLQNNPDVLSSFVSIKDDQRADFLDQLKLDTRWTDDELNVLSQINYDCLVELFEDDLPDFALEQIAGGGKTSLSTGTATAPGATSNSFSDKISNLFDTKPKSSVTIGGKVTNSNIQGEHITIEGK
jgi:hypothetical protein